MNDRFSSTLPALGEAPPIKKTALLKMMATEKEPPVGNVQDIRGYVTMYREKHEKELVMNKHEKAAEVHTMMCNFSKQAQRTLFNRRCKTALTTLRNKKSSTQTDEVVFDDAFTENEKNFETSTQNRWDKMKSRHAREMENHLNARPDDTPANFRRRSPALLTMMRQERRLFFQSRFEEAGKLRAECERLDAQEAAAQYREAIHHWEIKKQQLEDKHAKEEAAMREWILQRRAEYHKDRSTQQEALEKRKKLLEFEITNTSTIKRSATPHFIRRNICFDLHAKPKGQIESTPVNEEIDKLYLSLPPRSHEILQNLKP